MSGFDRVLMVDWSGGRDRGPRPKRDAIWCAVAGRGGRADEGPVYLRNRALAEAWLTGRIDAGLAAGERLLVGFDFPFGYPAGFAAALTGREAAFALWDWMAANVRDAAIPAASGAAGANDRFDVAGRINLALRRGIGPFWGNGLARDVPGLPRRGNDRTFRWPTPRRLCEQQAKGAFEVWQLSGAGSVGGQAIMGMPVLARLRARYGRALAVTPFEAASTVSGASVVLAEVWPSLIAGAVARDAAPGEIRDAAQVRVLARAVAALAPARLDAMLAEGRTAGAEGWILGLGHVAELACGTSGPRP